MNARLRVLAMCTGLGLGAPALGAGVAILDIGPDATPVQVRTVEEIFRRTGNALPVEVVPPLRAYLSVRLGEHTLLGYIRAEGLVEQTGEGTRLTVPVHVSRRGLYQSTAATAVAGVVLIRGYLYEEATQAFVRPFPVTLVNDHAAAVDMLRQGRARYAVLDEFIFQHGFREAGLRWVRTVENVTLNFGVSESAPLELLRFDTAICAMWRDGTMFDIHRDYYPTRAVFDMVREAVLNRDC